MHQSGSEECGGCNYFSWFDQYRMGEGGSASTVVIEENLWKHVKNEEKLGGNVKIEEHAVGGSLNTQEMRRSCVMSEEVVADIKICINSLEKRVKVLIGVVCLCVVLNIISVFLLVN